jgi:hypothetical protein
MDVSTSIYQQDKPLGTTMTEKQTCLLIFLSMLENGTVIRQSKSISVFMTYGAANERQW